MTSFDRKSPGSGCRRPKTRVYCEINFLQGCWSQGEAVTWQEMTSRYLKWPEVTRRWRHLIGSHLELPVEGRKLDYTVSFTCYKAVARRGRQSYGRKWRHMTSGDRKWPGMTSFDRKSPGSGCRRLKVEYTVSFTSYKAVARSGRLSHDRK